MYGVFKLKFRGDKMLSDIIMITFLSIESVILDKNRKQYILPYYN